MFKGSVAAHGRAEAGGGSDRGVDGRVGDVCVLCFGVGRYHEKRAVPKKVKKKGKSWAQMAFIKALKLALNGFKMALNGFLNGFRNGFRNGILGAQERPEG